MTLKQAFFILRHGSAEGNHKYLEAVKVIEDEYNRQKETIEQLQTALFKCGEELAEMQKTEGKANVKFKTGDSAKIVDNSSGHQFKIGTIVMLEKHKDNYKAYANGDYWWVTDYDLAEIDNDDLVKEFTEGGDGGQSLQEKLP